MSPAARRTAAGDSVAANFGVSGSSLRSSKGTEHMNMTKPSAPMATPSNSRRVTLMTLSSVLGRTCARPHLRHGGAVLPPTEVVLELPGWLDCRGHPGEAEPQVPEVRPLGRRGGMTGRVLTYRLGSIGTLASP